MAGREFRPYTSALPIETKEVTLIDRESDTFACTLEEKISMLRGDTDGDLAAVWVGRYETHAFHVDSSKALADVIRRALEGRVQAR